MHFLKKNNGIISFTILCFVIIWSFVYQMPSAYTTLGIADTYFSKQNALSHLKEISKKRHYIGAPAHKEVRDYIVTQLQELGLEVEIQTQLGVNKKWRSATQTKNIIAKIKGTQPSKSLVLLTHYDSNPHSSLGASDAGSGVVVILEGLRVFLEAQPQPKSDIIILITDAEEIGLNGADAFVNHHPWAKNIGLVLNFEARGSGGPSYMLLETNGGNAKLIKEFLKANPRYPVASSLMYSIYKMLPNDTDLTVFREDGNINGFNFAFIDDHFDYHTMQDSYERLDQNTLMHQASYLLPLLTYFSDADLTQLNSKEDLVYFNFPFVKMISFPFSWVMPLSILGFILFILIILYGLKQGRLSLKGIGTGFIPLLASLLSTGLIAFYGWKLLLIIYPQYLDILHGFTYNGYEYIAAFSAFTFALTHAIYNRFFTKQNSLDLSIAPLFLWLVISVLTAVYLKGAGFFIVPVLLALITLFIGIKTTDKSKSPLLLHTLLALPMLLIFAPLVKMFPVGLGLKNLFISSIFIVLLMGLLLPILAKYRKRKLLTTIGFIVCVVFLVKAELMSGYTAAQKQPNSILYVYDAEADKAYWTTYNNSLDAFTKQFFGDNPLPGSFDKATAPSKYKTAIKWHKPTDKIDLQLPLITQTVPDSVIKEINKYHFVITPQRAVNRIELIANTALHFKALSINGQAFEKKKNTNYVFNTEKRKHILSYYFTATNETLEIEFTLEKGEKPDITLYEASYDLFTNPNFKIQPRTDIMMPTPFVLNDAIVIKKKLLN